MKVAFVVPVVLALLLAGQAFADTLTWSFRNRSSSVAQLDFKSKSSHRWWPGHNKAWTLANDGGEHSYTLNCATGELITYGAMVLRHPSTYWGAGPRHDKSCNRCVATCGAGDAPLINLDD